MSSEDESSQEECALCDKEGYNFDFTPCCHERLCDDCEEDMMLYECSNHNCLKNDECKWCKICFDINKVSNRCKVDGCKYTWCDECSENHSCKAMEIKN